MRKAVKTDKSTKGTGPYSQAVISDGFVYVSGQGPLDVEGSIVGSDIQEQTKQTMDNVQEILRAAGCSMEDVIKAGVFLQDLNDFSAFNEVYESYFSPPLPARTTVESGLNGILVEIDVVAKIPDQRFTKQTVVVTGASRGIGKATAERFASDGAQVALLANDAMELERTVTEFRNKGYDVHSWVVDVSKPGQVDDTVEKMIDMYGKIDVLVNNAGIATKEDFLDIKDESWRNIVDVNLNGMFYVAQRVSRYMVKQGKGSIINMGSTNGLEGEVGYAHYNASKGGVVLLTKTMALELGKHGIRVNAVCPGKIVTPLSQSIDKPEELEEYVRTQIPLGRAGTMDDVAGVFAFLASEDAAFITGETIRVDGGQLAW